MSGAAGAGTWVLESFFALGWRLETTQEDGTEEVEADALSDEDVAEGGSVWGTDG